MISNTNTNHSRHHHPNNSSNIIMRLEAPQPNVTASPYKREISPSDDPNATAITIIKKPKSEGDGSSIELAKRPRGRPPGSKNKPKPPVIITRDAEPSSAMRPHVLEIPSGIDLIHSLSLFSRRKNLGLCVLAATGAVSNVTLRQPPHPTAPASAVAAPAATVGFHGRLEILSLSATVMPPAVAAVFSPGVAVSLAGPQGQVIGGTVVGPLVTAGTVTLVAATFENPTFHRLPAVEDDVTVSGSGAEKQQQQQQHVQQEPEEEEHYVHREYQQSAAETCGMAIYSSHFPTEVIWAPGARPPHPPPPY